ncbi:helix-turn-helix transcriptional regulator [Pseudoflavonifractor phocaeensis]|uniref:helix-turn-helix transcriptional regulator n=1 Tax=Pseudoflavonifractor phocaeensis TaxID=1870988 RepID=UPI00195C8F53|nr:helix-turn-helix transcriptional regulator [Pseudoflavonifractor phocaeensis]MBM6725329.1 helix-turn-helix transcriptional regulator [Pseudoflavonifractor phocaeensis]
MKLNENLISLRKDKRMSQQDLAEALNVSRQAVSRWEVGTAIPSMDNLLALSKLFGVPTDELMGADRGTDALESETVQGSGNIKGDSVLKVLLIILAAAVLAAAIVITYLNQKEVEPVEQNTVKFEELEEDEKISDSDAVKSGPIS